VADVMDVPAVRRWIDEFARLVDAEAAELTALDAAIGDADHGTNLQRGMTAVQAALQSPDEDPSAAASVGAILRTVAMTLISSVGGASGPLYGTFFLRLSAAAGSAEQLDGQQFAVGFRAAVDGVAARGKATKGDKTMYDALAPAADALDTALAAGHDLADAVARAATDAEAGRDAVTPLVARKGRASYLGERSAGHQDPGATSATLLIRAAATALRSPG
jgi:dihydroxyacetone kinase-like protein